MFKFKFVVLTAVLLGFGLTGQTEKASGADLAAVQSYGWQHGGQWYGLGVIKNVGKNTSFSQHNRRATLWLWFPASMQCVQVFDEPLPTMFPDQEYWPYGAFNPPYDGPAD